MTQLTGYLAPEGLEEQLVGELSAISSIHGRLVLAKGVQPSLWAQNIWFAPTEIKISSINDAAKQLKAKQRNWANYSFHLHRRAELIQQALPHVSAKPLTFPTIAPSSPLGSWTLLDNDTVLYSERCSSPFPNGEIRFVENHEHPPSRAYLKLWEALTRLGSWPQPGERCLDAGACPGGWSWVLASLGAEVIAIDRAPLDPRVNSMPGVSSRIGDAFQATPESIGSCDWVFSDMACYPERLYEWVLKWIEAKAAKQIVCSVKLQIPSTAGGRRSEFDLRLLADIPGSMLLHQFHNKHELTWIYSPKLATAL